MLFIFPDGAGDLKTVHDGHVQIHENGVKARRQDTVHRLLAGFRHAYRVTGVPEHEFDQFLAVRIVIDKQHRTLHRRCLAGLDCRDFGSMLLWRVHRREFEFEAELAAFAFFTLEREFPSHQRDQLARNAQCQADAAEAACAGSVHLRKWFEHLVMLMLRDADPGIADCKSKPAAQFLGGIPAREFSGHRNDDLAGICELHRVARHNSKYLPQAARVAHHPSRNAGGDVKAQRQALSLRLRAQFAGNLFHDFAQFERDRLQPQGSVVYPR